MPRRQAAFGARVYLLIKPDGVINGSLGHIAVVNVQVLLLPLPHTGRVLSEAIWSAERFAHAKTNVATHNKEKTKDVVKSFEVYLGLVHNEYFKKEHDVRTNRVQSNHCFPLLNENLKNKYGYK